MLPTIRRKNKDYARLMIKQKNITNTIRLNVVRTARNVGSVHFGGCFSIVEILAAYYAPIAQCRMSFDDFIAKNLLVLSKGHCGLAVYSILAALEVISQERLETYCKDGGDFMGHIKKDESLGIGWSTGSLGHGLSVAMGIASAYRDLSLPRRVLCILGDGEMHEGSNWEALLHLSHDPNMPLTILLDNNKFLSLGRTEDIRPLEPIASKIEQFRLPCVSVEGHDIDAIISALELGWTSERVLFINADTVKGFGVSFTQSVADWHAKRASDEELTQMEAELTGKES
jgi:transketolase